MYACMYVYTYVFPGMQTVVEPSFHWEIIPHATLALPWWFQRAQTQTKDREKLEQFTEPQPIFSISKSLKEWFYRLLFIRSEL